MTKRVLIPLAAGFEEIEALAVVDILRRAGIEVTMGDVTGDGQKPIKGRNGIFVMADCSLDEAVNDPFDMVVLPGGQPGTTNLKEDDRIKALIKKMHDDQKFIAAICAAPLVLSAVGIIDGKNITSHPGVKKDLSEVNYKDDRVVVDGHIVTSRGPGTAIEFAFKLVELLISSEKAEEVNRGVLANL